MFHVKEKISENTEINVEIHDDNVFCICPGCGCEVVVDLSEIFGDGEGDLYGTAVYCSVCSKSRLEEHYGKR
jgi:hypothetical protein